MSPEKDILKKEYLKRGGKINYNAPIRPIKAREAKVIEIGGLSFNTKKAALNGNLPGIYKNCMHLDIVSCYPSLILNHSLVPNRIEDKELFLKIYRGFYDKKLTGDPDAKLIINKVYGNMHHRNDTGCWLHDPALAKEINNLAKEAMLYLITELGKVCKVIYVSTDGLIITDIRENESVWDVVDDFECKFNLKLKSETYKEVGILSQNNYYADKELKGQFKSLSLDEFKAKIQAKINPDKYFIDQFPKIDTNKIAPMMGKYSYAFCKKVQEKSKIHTFDQHHNFRYYCPNPIKACAIDRKITSIEGRKAVVLEFDNLSLEAQYKRFKRYKPSFITYSGGKSLHATIIFNRYLTQSESKGLDEWLKCNFGDSDNSTWRINQLVRVPNAKRENGTCQNLIEVNQVWNVENFFKKFKIELCKIEQVEYEKIESENLENKLQKIRNANINLKESEETNFIKFTGYCPLITHKKQNPSEFVIQVFKDSGVVQAKCSHNTCKDKTTANFLKALDIESVWDRYFFAEPSIFEGVKSGEISEIIERENWAIISAGTGTGKTYSMLKHIADNCKTDKKYTFITDTKNNVDRAYEQLRIFGVEAVKLYQGSKDADLTKAKVILTHHHYLGLRGTTNTLFKTASKFIDNRVVLIDEAAELHNLSIVSIPLAALYKEIKLETGSRLEIKHNCLKTATKGGCSNCTWRQKRKECDNNREHKFYIDQTQLDKDKEYNYIFPTDDNYKHIQGTLFAKFLEEKLELDLDKLGIFATDSKDNLKFDDYVNVIYRTSINPHIRQQFATYQDKILSHENLRDQHIKYNKKEENYYNDIKFPKSTPCRVKYFCGLNLIPYIQLKKAKKLIMASATFKNEQIEAIQKVLDMELYKIADKNIKFKFNPDVIRLEKHLSNQQIKSVLDGLGSVDSLICGKNESSSKEIYKAIKNLNYNIRKVVTSDYEDKAYTNRDKDKDKDGNIIVAYPDAAYCQGNDLPKLNLCIVDARCYIPLLGIDTIKESDTKEIISSKMTQIVHDRITQIVGRGLRSEIDYKGELVIDPKRYVVAIHGLDFNFTIDEKLTYSIRYHNENICGSGAKSLTTNLRNNIIRLLSGKEPVLYNLTKTKTKISIDEKVKLMIKEGYKKNEIKDRIHYFRLGKADKKRIDKILAEMPK